MSIPCCSEVSPQGINSSLLIDTAIRLSNPFMGSSTQWGSLSSSTHPPIIFFFHPFGTLSFQCCSLGWNFGECFAPFPPFLFAWCLVLLFWISSWCIPQYTSVVGGKLQNLRPLIDTLEDAYVWLWIWNLALTSEQEFQLVSGTGKNSLEKWWLLFSSPSYTTMPKLR